MSETYAIYEIDDNRESLETRGSKEKFWLRHSELGRCLFKFPRANTGEDWSERIAARAANALGLPCARYELAVLRRGHERFSGILSVDFLAKGEELVSGHSLLMEHTDQYPPRDGVRRYDSKVAEYTIPTVVSSLDNTSLALPPTFGVHEASIQSAADLFLGYLMLDALIGNQDRHHENWGVVQVTGIPSSVEAGHRFLAPTFDHASSLGRLLNDTTRQDRLSTRDYGYSIEAYCARARSPFHSADGRRQLSTHEAVAEAARLRSPAISYWRNRLQDCREADLVEWVQGVPTSRMSEVAMSFALKMLRTNRRFLLKGDES